MKKIADLIQEIIERSVKRLVSETDEKKAKRIMRSIEVDSKRRNRIEAKYADFPHEVSFSFKRHPPRGLSVYDKDHRKEMTDWLGDHFTPTEHWTSVNYVSGSLYVQGFLFKNVDHAMLFKLRWVQG